MAKAKTKNKKAAAVAQKAKKQTKSKATSREPRLASELVSTDIRKAYKKSLLEGYLGEHRSPKSK
jgi:hypothetical protein